MISSNSARRENARRYVINFVNVVHVYYIIAVLLFYNTDIQSYSCFQTMRSAIKYIPFSLPAVILIILPAISLTLSLQTQIQGCICNLFIKVLQNMIIFETTVVT